MRRIFHLENKADKHHDYYGSLTALCHDNVDLGVSKGKLDRYNFDVAFENEKYTIRKSVIKTTAQLDLKGDEKKNKK